MPRVKSTTSKASTTKKTTKTSTTKKKTTPKKRKTTTKRTSKPKSKKVKVEIVEDEKDNFVPEEIEEVEEGELDYPDLPTSSEEDELYNDEEDEIEEDEKKYNLDNIDQQRKYFSSLQHENSDYEEPRPSRSLGLYKKLVVRFIILVFFLIAVVFYFSFSKLTIYITPKGETINDSMLLKVSNTKKGPGYIKGNVREVEENVSKEYQSTGEEYEGEEIEGEVTIINKYNRNQPLVARTRLLTPDNKLFRIKNRVNVPARGSVKVAIYADKPSIDMAVGPTTFTIPGLWVGLQDKIYAKSDKKFVFKQKIKKYVKASDINRAKQNINQLLLQKAKNKKYSLSGEEGTLYDIIGSVESEVKAKAGDNKDAFTATAKGKIVIVSFSKDEALKLAKAKLKMLVSDDKELINFDSKHVYYSLEGYDPETGVATIKVSFKGTMILKNDNSIIDKKKLVNLKEGQIKSYLNSFSEIERYELKFSPVFVKKAPKLPDRIIIKIGK